MVYQIQSAVIDDCDAESGKSADIGTGKGYFVEQTVFADVNSDMTIAREESFGPILSIVPFDTFEDAIRIANGNQYGLASGVHTCDIKKAHKAAARCRLTAISRSENIKYFVVE